MTLVTRQLRALLTLPPPRTSAPISRPKSRPDDRPAPRAPDIRAPAVALPTERPPTTALPTYLLPARRIHDLPTAPLREAFEVSRSSAEPEEDMTTLPFVRLAPALPLVRAARPPAMSPRLPLGKPEPMGLDGRRSETTLVLTQPPFMPVLASRQGSVPSPPYAFSLAEYASLCAELAAARETVEATFARYGLSNPEVRRAVDTTWRARFARHPTEYACWHQLFAYYRAQLTGAQGV